MSLPAALLLLFSTLTFEAVDARVEQTMKAAGVPGAAIVVVKDGAVVHARGFGVVSIEGDVPVTTKTLFRLGSTTKMFVALATLKLARDGKLRLDQPVGELVPGLAPPLRKITVEQLLTHTAGLADDAPMTGPLDEGALHERVTGWGEDALFAPPGEVFSYANTGYVLLGDVIAQTTKQPFSTAIESLVLKPAGMRDSTFRPLDALTHPIALGHDGKGVIRPFAEHAGNYPPGSLFTSVDDLGRFLAALPEETLEELAKPRAAIPAQDRTYGYGLITDKRRGPRLILHTGARSGYGSTIMFLPDQHVAVAVLANRTGATLSSAAFAALEGYATITEPTPPAATEPPLSSSEIAALSGTYVNGRLPVVELAADGDRLVVRVAGKTLAVKNIGEGRFHVEGGAQLETFIIMRDLQGAPRFLCAETWALQKQALRKQTLRKRS